jgi:acyl-CoA synthetase (AMP-forming)/AMP-acid ligase II
MGLNTRLGRAKVAAIFDRAEPRLAVLDHGPPPAGCRHSGAQSRRADCCNSAAPRRAAAPSLGLASDPAVMIWTSGTTGLPKGAWFDHDNLRAAVESAGVMAAPFDRRLVTTPFAHAGYMAKLWEQLAWATTLVITPTPWSAADMVHLLGAERITVAGGAPTQWAKVVDHPDLARTDVSRLRLCVAATAPAPPDLVERVTHQLVCPLVVRYAMTDRRRSPAPNPATIPKSVPYRRTTANRRRDGTPRRPGTLSTRRGRARARAWCVRDARLLASRNRRKHSTAGMVRTSDLGAPRPAGNLVLSVGRATCTSGGYNVYPLG